MNLSCDAFENLDILYDKLREFETELDKFISKRNRDKVDHLLFQKRMIELGIKRFHKKYIL